MLIDAYATHLSYWRHLAAIVDELRARGHEVRCWRAQKPQPWGEPLGRRREPAPVALCASWVDANALAPQRCVYVEHGAGQAYLGSDGRGYAGADGLDHVVLFLGPGEHVSQRWRARYPRAAVESVGCPALDRHFVRIRGAEPHPDPMVELHVAGMAAALRAAGDPDDESDDREDDEDRDEHRPIVAISSHWRCFRLPETMPALPYFERGISELVRLEGIQLLGHAHPRAEQKALERWERLGVPYDPDPDEILRRADLLVVDNSSLAYEAAALDIPVLLLNSPRYRREVEHGLRFWEFVPGIQCDSVSTFLPAVMAALDDPPEARALRARAAEHVYRFRDGSSTRRAVDAIEALAL